MASLSKGMKLPLDLPMDIVVSNHISEGKVFGMTNGGMLDIISRSRQVMRDLHDSQQVDPRKMHARVMGKPKQKPTTQDVLKNPTRRIMI